MGCLARTPTTTDAFNAVAEASRRQLLDALGTGEATVGELVDRLGMTQPQVSKHLGVLRAVGLVLVRVDGRHRWYRVNGPALRPIHDWVRTFYGEGAVGVVRPVGRPGPAGGLAGPGYAAERDPAR